MKIRAFRLLAFSGVLAAVSAAHGQDPYTYRWKDGLLWSSAANWVDGLPPVDSYLTRLLFQSDSDGSIQNDRGRVNLKDLDLLGRAYTLQGGTLAFADGGTLRTDSSFTDVRSNLILGADNSRGYGTFNLNVVSGFTYLSGRIDGLGGLVKTGGGSFALFAANTYAGGTTLSGGSLFLGSSNEVLAKGDLTFNGGNLELNNNSVTVRNLTFGDGIATNTGTINGSGTLYVTGNVSLRGRSDGTTAPTRISGLVNLANGIHTFSDNGSGGSLEIVGGVTGDGGIEKTGDSALTLSGTSSYTGGTRIRAGSLNVTNLVGDYAVDGALKLNAAADATYGGAISGKGSFTLTGGKTLVLSAPLTHTGGTTVQVAKLFLTGDDQLPVGGDLSLVGSLSSSDPQNTLLSSYRPIKLTLGNVSVYDSIVRLGGSEMTVASGTLTPRSIYLNRLVKTGPLDLNLGAYSIAIVNEIELRGGTTNLIDAFGPDLDREGLHQFRFLGGDLNVRLYAPTRAGSLTFGNGTKSGHLGDIRGGFQYGGGLVVASGNASGDIFYAGRADRTSDPVTIDATIFLTGSEVFLGGNSRSRSDVDVTISGLIGERSQNPNVQLSKVGTSVYRLTGPAQYTGGTDVREGTLIVERPSGNYATSADLRFDTPGPSTIGSSSGDGDLTKTGEGSLTVGGVLGNVGRIDVLGGSVVAAGRGLYGGSFTLGKDAEFVNLSGGTVEFAKDAVVDGSFTTTRRSATVFDGFVTGAGSFDGLGTVTFKGGYSPGNSPASVEIESRVTFASDLTMELAGTTLGTGYDHLTLDSLATLGGGLKVAYYGGFRASAGQRFDLFDWDGGLSGRFSSVLLPTLGGGLSWDTSALYTSGVISVQAVPEPTAFVALGVGLLGLLRRRRRA